MKNLAVGWCGLCLLAGLGEAADAAVRIGNFDSQRREAIAFVYDDAAAFVMWPDRDLRPGLTAPDDSIHQFNWEGVRYEWGRVGDAVVGRMLAEQPVHFNIMLKSRWPGFTSVFTPNDSGATGEAVLSGGKKLEWRLNISGKPTSAGDDHIAVDVTPERPLYFTAGCGELPPLTVSEIDAQLAKAAAAYESRRPRADGDLGDFVGAIASNMNNTRIYSSDNKLVAISVSHGWSSPNANPYFCWDTFFNALLTHYDDPETGRQTVRGILQCQTPEGLVPNFGHWKFHDQTASNDRSQPPVGALCVWRMHQLRPDAAFLREVYPALAKWHAWWMKARNPKGDGLLSWGSSTGGMQEAQWETGWDDTPAFEGSKMVGETMNAYALDLSSLWSMDAYFLALIADAIGRPEDAKKHRLGQAEMNRRINERLWNEELGLYCNRLWDYPVPDGEPLTVSDGFEVEFFNDMELRNKVKTGRDKKIDWSGAPRDWTAGDRWSARWQGTFTAPAAGGYRFTVAADDGVRLKLDGKTVIEDWSVHMAREKEYDMELKQGQAVSVSVEYYQEGGGAELHFSVARLKPERGKFITRLTPMNFYPLLCGAPDRQRADKLLAVMTDPQQFWGEWVIPTVSRQDPVFHEQGYWHGTVWGPVNYLIFQGLRRYAPPQVRADYAEKNVRLFMKNWDVDRYCSENYLSTSGEAHSNHQYTWGALLNLVGIESIVSVSDDGKVEAGAGVNRSVELRNIVLGGQLYNIKARGDKIEILKQ